MTCRVYKTTRRQKCKMTEGVARVGRGGFGRGNWGCSAGGKNGVGFGTGFRAGARLVCMNADSKLQTVIDEGKRLGKSAFYFGCWDSPGHYLHGVHGYLRNSEQPYDLPWDEAIMDTGLLRNGKVPDIPDGRVYFTCGGATAFWYAFYWWDRSVDSRGACNSGFYVRGFGWPEEQAAFDYACSQFPHVVKRQRYPLKLQTKSA